MLTDDDLTADLRAALAETAKDIPPPRADLVRVVRARHARHRRLALAARVAAPAAVLALLVGLTARAADPTPPGGVASGPSVASAASAATADAAAAGDATAGSDAARIRLDGYLVTLPPGYSVRSSAAADTNCTGQLHLAAGQASTVIATPAAGCPLSITAVTRVLPAGARRRTVPGVAYGGASAPQSLVWYDDTTSTGQAESYFPAELPSGASVYVTFAGDRVAYQQIVDLADGLRVLPAGPPCTGPCG